MFLTGVGILAGAFTAFLAEVGIVSIATRALSSLLRPLFASDPAWHQGERGLAPGAIWKPPVPAREQGPGPAFEVAVGFRLGGGADTIASF